MTKKVLCGHIYATQTRPFYLWTCFDHMNTRLVQCSDGYCISQNEGKGVTYEAMTRSAADQFKWLGLSEKQTKRAFDDNPEGLPSAHGKRFSFKFVSGKIQYPYLFLKNQVFFNV